MGYGVWGVGCGVWGMGCGVWGVGCGVWGVGCRDERAPGRHVGSSFPQAFLVRGRIHSGQTREGVGFGVDRYSRLALVVVLQICHEDEERKGPGIRDWG